jgi:hypothetical protein
LKKNKESKNLFKKLGYTKLKYVEVFKEYIYIYDIKDIKEFFKLIEKYSKLK